jgi:Sulfotransferase family
VGVGETRPNFFVVGAARSGTTMLAEVLRQHPDVFVTRPKEPHFLAFAGRPAPVFTGPGDAVTINRAVVTDLDDYLALYRPSGRCRARGDASVSSLYYPEQTLETLTRHFADARVVAILREPGDRAYSAYSYLRVRGFEPCDDFGAALALEPERIASGWHHLWHYVEMGRYARQLEPFLEKLGSERVLVLFYDDLCRDAAGVARRLFEFLDVDAQVAVSSVPVNVSGTPRSQLFQNLVYRVARRPLLRAAVKSATPFALRERIRRASLELDNAPREADGPLSELFAEEVAALASLLECHYPGAAAAATPWLPLRESTSKAASL